MKSIIASSALVVLAVVQVALADNCNVGLIYCGSSLLGKGNYQPQIDQCIFDNHQSTQDNGASTLFQCAGGPNGVIQYLVNCGIGHCHDGGSGKNDTCV
ncbi:hypothetical protein BDP27DRAFT_1298418 [Rhodocollybia butyracea]|uniref:Uncharacterized protein n=1 Tax=Rhodocollybia butyracea TaxID=206335 RepID=A0A9P5U2Z0_9AGAR|nr:hypothetical protein BDP27DRAFT_1298418 [Rhodocollybia butyracea]